MGSQRGTKRKKPGVGVDFKKVKHKVGRKVAKAQNETDVNFKVRAINLPSQILAEDKSGQATSYQKLTLKELLAQSRHYSSKNRKHAITGLIDLLSKHPTELKFNIATVITTLVERITDEEASVRQLLKVLMRDTVLMHVDQEVLRPFFPILMAHVTGAMTHLLPDVRMSSLGFLEALVSRVPGLLSADYVDSVLLHFCQLLSASQRARSIRAQSVASTLKVVSALQSFLKAVRRAADQTGPERSSGGSRSSPAGICFRAPLMVERCTWPTHAKRKPMHHEGAAQTSKVRVEKKVEAGSSNLPSSVALPLQLLTCVWAAWPEVHPDPKEAGAKDSHAEALSLMSASLDVTVALLEHLKTAAAEHELASSGKDTPSYLDLLAHLAPVVLPHLQSSFPTPLPTHAPALSNRDALITFRMRCCDVMNAFLPLLASQAGESIRGMDWGWVDTLVSYYQCVLSNNSALDEDTDNHGASTSSQAPGSLLPVLKGVAAAAPLLSSERRNLLLAGLGQAVGRLPACSATRAAALEIQHRLMRIAAPEEVKCWLEALPKLLWDLGDSHPQATEVALRMLLDKARSAPSSDPSLAAMQPTLAPLFLTVLSRGGRSKADASSLPVLPGPVTRMNPTLASLAVDLLYHLAPLGNPLSRALLALVHTQLLDESLTLRIVEVVLRGHLAAAALAPMQIDSQLGDAAHPAVMSGDVATISSRTDDQTGQSVLREHLVLFPSRKSLFHPARQLANPCEAVGIEEP